MNLLGIFNPFWPWLMGFAVYISAAGALTGNRSARQIGSVMLSCYVLMQLKKLGFHGEYGFAVGMLVWASAAAYIANEGLRQSGNYGIPLIHLIVALMLLLSGACYLWGHLAGAESKFLAPHALTADLLAIAAMLIAGHGLGREVAGVLFESWGLGASHRSGH